MDNGPELAGKVVDHWGYERGAQLRFMEPGKPVQNAVVERVHGRLRDECLNRHRVLGLNDARSTVERWRPDDHQTRPHRALGYRSPAALRRRFAETAVMRQTWDARSAYVDQPMGAGHSPEQDSIRNFHDAIPFGRLYDGVWVACSIIKLWAPFRIGVDPHAPAV